MVGVAVATVAPLLPAPPPASGLVPLDTWVGAHVPGVRDVYRQYLARAVEPWRLPALAGFVAMAIGIVGAWRGLGVWLAARVPRLSPAGLAAFRVVYGLALVAALASVRAPDVVPLDAQRSASWFASLPAIRELAATPGAAAWLRQGALAALACVVAGVFARQALIVAALLLSLFVGVLLTVQATHDWDVPLVTLWMMTLVPWNTSLGLVSLLSAAPPEPALDARRGLAVWIPGFTIGLAFAAAAFAKLDTSGLAWITGGAVRFHFIEDAGQAPTTWGLALTRSPGMAALLAGGAVAVEACFWIVTLCRGSLARAAFGASAVALLFGFYAFQGVFWPAWWAMLVAFLPWPEIDRWLGRAWPRAAVAGGAPVPRPLTTAARAAVTGLVLVQVGASLLRVENEPLFSDFAMYAYTWESQEAFGDHLASKTRRLVLSAPGQPSDTLDGRLRELPRAADIANAGVGLALRGEPWPEDVRAAVAAMRAEYFERYGERLDAVEVSSVARRFDWARYAMDPEPRIDRQGIVDLERGVLAGAP